MNKFKVQNQIDGTLLFEKLCVIVVANFLNVSVNNSFIFGTANSGNFEKKVKQLIIKIGEGTTFINRNNNTPTAKDDALDVVAWKEFSDSRPGKLIAFGQCKTGTSWRDRIRDLNPRRFCKSWFHTDPILTPIPMVFLADTMNMKFNFITTQDDLLVFNRFRVTEYLQSNVPKEIKDDVQKWVTGALKTLESLSK